MLKFLLSILRGGIIAVVFVIFAGWVLGSSASFKSCMQDKQTQGGYNQLQENLAALPVCLGTFVHKYRDELIASFTVVLALSTIYLWFATGDLVRGAERTAKRQLRAYIHLHHIIQASVDPFGFNIDFKNFGQTPAHKVTVWYHSIVREVPIKGNLIPRAAEWGDRGQPSNALLAPGATLNCPTTGVIITEIDRAKLVSGESAIYVFGDIRYRDVFGHRRWTAFRYLHSHGGFAVCDEGNKAK